MSILEKTKQKIKNCPKCHGRLSYFNEQRELVRCCRRENNFLKYYKKAGAIDQYVSKPLVNLTKKWMAKHDIFCVCVVNHTLRTKVKHSAAYMASMCNEYTKMYDDGHLIQSVFHRIEVEDGENMLANYYEPTFLILELGITPNKDYIEHFIVSLLERRLADGNKTLVLIPSGNCLKDKYNSEQLDNYFTKDLKDRDAFVNLTKESA